MVEGAPNLVEKHPHARGEDKRRASSSMPPEETPPRTWGRQEQAAADATLYGNTPTHVGKTAPKAYGCVPVQKHPHARGEDLSHSSMIQWMRETPPRTWGRPAAAFSTPSRRWKHPHARGEDISANRKSSQTSETPPRTWGRQYLIPNVKTDDRNTPTHVGKTLAKIGIFKSSQKHPHARGEDSTLYPTSRLMIETPPRTWGRPDFIRRTTSATRNTPTHVGKTVPYPQYQVRR